MRFDKYLPCPALQPYVKYFAFSEAEEEQSYKVIPGASLVLGMQYRGKLQKLKDGSNISLSTAGITGLLDSYQVFTNSKNIGTLLVFFTETGASHFFICTCSRVMGSRGMRTGDEVRDSGAWSMASLVR